MKRSGLLALAAALAAFSPFRAEERNVREGNERMAAGDPATALRRYDDAERAAGPHGEIDYDRGDALYRMGRLPEARQAWSRALDRLPGPLASRAHQNLGTALAAGGDNDGAVAAFTEALRRDPANEDARFDLEVMLRRKQQEEERRKQEQEQRQGQQDQHQGQGQKQEQKQEAGRDQEQAQDQRSKQGRPDKKDGAPEQPSPGQPDQRAERRPQAGGEPEGAQGEVSRKDAERILDAFRASERIAPPQGERRWLRRADGDRDW